MNAEPQIFLKNFGLRYLHYSCSIWESWLKNISFLLKILWHLPKLPSYTRCSHHGWQSTLCIHILLCKRLLSLNSWCPLKSLSDSRKRSISIVPCPSIPPPPPLFFIFTVNNIWSCWQFFWLKKWNLIGETAYQVTVMSWIFAVSCVQLTSLLTANFIVFSHYEFLVHNLI